jgi:O-methyltransferase
VAELGVYEGDFAALLHSHLPDRAIHLFDTFAGFADADVRIDQGQFSKLNLPDFSNTTIADVRSKFPSSAKVIVHPGWFPHTAKVVDDTRFAAVSIDVDLYQPILEGLRFFWPRLSPGGFILVHDYNNQREFPGTHRAVKEFMREAPIVCCPVPDDSGTAVIGKPLLEFQLMPAAHHATSAYNHAACRQER